VVGTVIVPGEKRAIAQPSSPPVAPANADPRTTAKRLVADGIAAYTAKDYGKAISLYMRAFSLDPHPRLLFNVAQALRLAGCVERAVAFYERYLTLEPQGGESETARAVLAERKGRRSSASSVGATGATSCSVAASLMEAPPAAAVESTGRRSTGRLRLNSKPDGVTVMLDGVKIGATPLEREVAAGGHMVALVDRGRLVGEQKVEVGEGAVAEVTMPVVYPPDDANAIPSSKPSRTLSIALFGGASTALVASAYFFYLGQHGGSGHPEERYRYPYANGTALALVGVGAAAIGVGIWLWLREPRHQESAPVAAISADGSYLGWQGRF
jgi:tetratricopeptide (TPR) repeat protein